MRITKARGVGICILCTVLLTSCDRQKSLNLLDSVVQETLQETTAVLVPDPVVGKAEGRDTYTNEPYALVNPEIEMTDTNLKKYLKVYDWDSIFTKNPDSYYESFSKYHAALDSAVLYKEGETVETAVDDPRLIKLINFHNNCRYHVQCAWIQGMYPPDESDEMIEYPVRLERHFSDIGEYEALCESMHLVYDPPASYGASLCEIIGYSSMP